MGRYYSTQNWDGKFGFGIQSSFDPVDVFGMYDNTPDDESDDGVYGCFYLEDLDGAKEAVRSEVDKLYDFLHIAASRRFYSLQSDNQLWELFDEFEPIWFRPFEKGKDKGIPYYSPKVGEGIVEREPGIQLAKCRLELGLKILSDLEKDGYCSMEAEL